MPMCVVFDDVACSLEFASAHHPHRVSASRSKYEKAGDDKKESAKIDQSPGLTAILQCAVKPEAR